MQWSLRLLILPTSLLTSSGMFVVQADEVPRQYRDVVDRGLQWLAARQAPDGHWGEQGKGRFGRKKDRWSVAVTSMSAMTMLMEGGTVREGKYRENIRRARDWLLKQQIGNGLITDPGSEDPVLGYMHSHGFAALFLACLAGDEETSEHRTNVAGALEKACRFICNAQTSRGGWGYKAAQEGNDFDEGSVTVTQLQALRAARNAGVVVPAAIIQRAVQYLRKAVLPDGGVGYSLAERGLEGHPALTAAAIACGYSAGEYHQSPDVKTWFLYCRKHLPLAEIGEYAPYHEYCHYYYAQAVYMLGEDGWRKMFPESPAHEALTWSKYRKTVFDAICKRQKSDGSWSARDGVFSSAGLPQVYPSACCLTILQLDKGVLPIYQR